MKMNTVTSVMQNELKLIQENPYIGDETKVKNIISLLFKLKSETAKTENALAISNFVLSNNISGIENFSDYMSAQRSNLGNDNFKIIWNNVTLNFSNIVLNEDTATVFITEQYEYILDRGHGYISTEVEEYIITLQKNDKWLISDIEGTADTYKAFTKNKGNAVNNTDLINYDLPLSIDDVTGNAPASASLVAATPYNRTEVFFYAWSYALGKNSIFPFYTDSDCQNFASQCVWAGFGGINDATHVKNRSAPMVTNSGARNWYPGLSSWSHVGGFEDLLVDTNSSSVGLYGSVVPGISAFARVGDVIQVDLENDGKFNHSYIIDTVTGTAGNRTAANIYVSAHTDAARSVLLSSYSPGKRVYRTVLISGHN